MKHRQKICLTKNLVDKLASDIESPEFAEPDELQYFKKPINQVIPQMSQEQEDCQNLNLEIGQAITRLNFLMEDKQFYTAYESVMKLFNSTLKTHKPHLQQICNQAQSDNIDLKQEIITHYEEIQKIRTWFQLQTNWIVESSANNYSVRYQLLSGTSVIVVRIDTEVNLPLNVFLGLIYETDLYPQWFPFCDEMKTIIEPDKATKILRHKLKLPLVSDREMIIKGWGVNNMDHEGKIYVLVRSIDLEPDTMNKMNVIIQDNPKVVRGFVHIFSFEIEPISINKHKVTVLSSFDLKLKGVPTYFPNLFVRKFSGQLFKKLLSLGETYQGSQWEKNQKQSPQFYEWMNQTVQNYFAKKQSFQLNL